MPRITFIHATRVAIDPIEQAVRTIWPKAEAITILEEGLSVDRQKSPHLSDALCCRIKDLTEYATTMKSDGILFTCSAFGEAIETAAAGSPIPVMKPNEAMFDAVLAQGDRVAMIYTFPPAAAGMEEEFRQAAEARGRDVELKSYFCEDAFDAKRAGDDDRHDRLIAQTAQAIADADVIMLAQFSMAGAADAVRQKISVPVLTSPEAAIRELRRRVEAGSTC